jgi:hypothetical protein
VSREARLTDACQFLPQRLVEEFLIRRAVELQDIEVVSSQRREGRLDLGSDVGGGPVASSVLVTVKVMAELRCNDPRRPLVLKTFSNEAFRKVISVALRRVDEVDALVTGGAHDRIDVSGGEVDSPLATKLPRSDTDDTDDQPGTS